MGEYCLLACPVCFLITPGTISPRLAPPTPAESCINHQSRKCSSGLPQAGLVGTFSQLKSPLLAWVKLTEELANTAEMVKLLPTPKLFLPSAEALVSTVCSRHFRALCQEHTRDQERYLQAQVSSCSRPSPSGPMREFKGRSWSAPQAV